MRVALTNQCACRWPEPIYPTSDTCGRIRVHCGHAARRCERVGLYQVHGPNVRSELEVGAPHEPERRTPMRLDGNYFASSRIGVRRSDQVHGPNVRPKLEVEASHEPEHRTPMRVDGNSFATSRIGVRRSDRVHGPNARPELEVTALP